MSPPRDLAQDQSLQRTALYSLHLHHGARMVEFAGYAMPVQYPGGIRHEHEHTRSQAGLFDVSHMGQFRLRGEGADAALEGLVTGDLTGLQPYRPRYTLLTNTDGGIIDDLMVTRVPDGLFLVVNAARKDTDFEHIQTGLGAGCELEQLDDRALLALQGPAAAAVMERLQPAVSTLKFMQAGDFSLNGTDCFITRSGYTGEDGFEISLPADRAGELAEQLLEQAEVEPIGLGARDTLRLEAGLCLYGHDLDESTTPVEAALSWVIGKKYRAGESRARFPGAGVILGQLQTGTDRTRVGLRVSGRMPVRAGTRVLDAAGEEVGGVTSGGFAPSIGAPVAMGYVASNSSGTGTALKAQVRGRELDVEVCDLPFIKPRYHKH